MRPGIKERYYVVTVHDIISKKRKFICQNGITSDKLKARRYTKGEAEIQCFLLQKYNPVILKAVLELKFKPMYKSKEQRTFT